MIMTMTIVHYLFRYANIHSRCCGRRGKGEKSNIRMKYMIIAIKSLMKCM